MIVSGSQQALEISGRVLLDPKCPVWIEEPCYAFARDAFASSGCRFVPVPVDREGLNVAVGVKRCRSARVALVTPSHQFPLGMTMSLERRLQLLNWATTTGAWIVEDDYDSEFRYKSLPIASLHGLDADSRVIYVGSFSKVLFPSLRVGYAVVPHDLIDRFKAVRRAMDLGPSTFSQEVLAEFLAEGHFGRHIRRMRMVYRERRTALVNSLNQELGPNSKILGDEAGLQLVMTLPDGIDDIQLAMKAASQNLCLWPLSTAYSGKGAQRGFILGFGGTTAEEMPAAVRKLKMLLVKAKVELKPEGDGM